MCNEINHYRKGIQISFILSLIFFSVPYFCMSIVQWLQPYFCFNFTFYNDWKIWNSLVYLQGSVWECVWRPTELEHCLVISYSDIVMVNIFVTCNLIITFLILFHSPYPSDNICQAPLTCKVKLHFHAMQNPKSKYKFHHLKPSWFFKAVFSIFVQA